MEAEEIAGKLAVTCFVVVFVIAAIISSAGLGDDHPVYILASLALWTGIASGIAWIWL